MCPFGVSSFKALIDEIVQCESYNNYSITFQLRRHTGVIINHVINPSLSLNSVSR